VSTVALVEPIKINGLAQFSKDLRKLDGDLPKALRLAANEAGELVLSYAKPRVRTGPQKGGHAASSLRAKSTRTSARVTAGGARYPYYAWLDFGGRVGRKKATRRPFKKAGRYLFVGYLENKPRIARELEESLIDIARQAGIEVT
jgi:hypothetical protein